MKIAVVGLGFMGATHARSWMRIEGADLYAVVSRNERRLQGDLRDVGGNLPSETAQLDFSNVERYRTFEEALDDDFVQAVDLCVPTDRHAEMAIAALRRKKHVLVEKPLALTAEDADRVAGEARDSGCVLMVAHVLRFMPAYVEARERIGQLGGVRAASFHRRCAAPEWSEWLRDPARSGGGTFDLLIHDADYARWLFGMPRWIKASGASDPGRGLDLLTAQLDYENFAVTISGGWHLSGAYPFSMEFTIVCEGGVLEYCCGALAQYVPGELPEVISLAAHDPFDAELSHFLDCAQRNEPSLVCPPSESADAVRLMRAILDSI